MTERVDCTQSLKPPAQPPNGESQRPDDPAPEVAINIDGNWTIANAADLMELLVRSLAQKADLVADFTGVLECDTAVLQLICSWRRTAVQRGRRVRITAWSPAIESAAAALGVSLTDLSAARGGDRHGL